MAVNFTDQLNRNIRPGNYPPKRIVSLVPSQTELLYYLGLDNEVAGQTLFCIHPHEQHLEKPRVGGTKKLQLDKIRELNPDLIIGNKEENAQSQVEILMQEYPVWMSDIKTLNDALDMIGRVGELTDRKEAAQKLVSQISHQFNSLIAPVSETTALYLVWRNPWMAVGADTFISDMMTRAGWLNVLAASHYHDQRYPELSEAELAALDPDLILLSSEPFPFKEQHVQEIKMICPGARILLVDGELFSWYGNRLLQTADYLKMLNTGLSV